MGIKCDFHRIKIEFQKIVNLLDTTSDNKDLRRFLTKKWIEVYDQSGGENYNVNKEIRIKTPMLRSDLWGFNDAYILLLLMEELMLIEEMKVLHLKIVDHLLTAFQR